MLTGQIITAEQAANWGLVDLVFGDGELFTKVQEISESMAGMPEETVSVCKKLVYETQNLTVEDAPFSFSALSKSMNSSASPSSLVFPIASTS